MTEYEIKYTNFAVKNLNEIFDYISLNLREPATAENILNELEKTISSLQYFPYRCHVRNKGTYAGMGYRQLFIKNFNVIYRIDESKRCVIIITVRYAKSSF